MPVCVHCWSLDCQLGYPVLQKIRSSFECPVSQPRKSRIYVILSPISGAPWQVIYKGLLLLCTTCFPATLSYHSCSLVLPILIWNGSSTHDQLHAKPIVLMHFMRSLTLYPGCKRGNPIGCDVFTLRLSQNPFPPQNRLTNKSCSFPVIAWSFSGPADSQLLPKIRVSESLPNI